ncbi:NADPH:quinone oxidoreductase family protein [Gordonia hankookensis]|uniref:NADPH:quinone oxidoreductase family protein n=1 Tax=Gordonia hankookensis TaxID=589403 RepID=A0ABR7W9G6_9ACTN|nr:NADPH:quinone oxidoreductase family protein [Gordonia hankookensis]MBD1319450.1 NADPH:quinone oxidoreductase family protein [Gordonia hankookensis]
MRAALCTSHGPPENITVQEIPSPTLGDGRVRIQVEFAAVNFPDVLVVANDYQVKVPTPFVPGSEFAGIVSEVGGHDVGFAIGDRVMGTGLFGAFAAEVVTETRSLSHVPDGIDTRLAAASGVAYRTAYHSLRSVARVEAGDSIVVLGAGGGVGLAAVGLGTALGADVIAVASSQEKLDVAKRYGATGLINHRDADLRASLKELLPQGAAAVIDPVGGSLSEPALRSLRRGGRFVTIGFASGEIPRIPLNLVLVKGIHILGFQFGDVAPDEFTRNEEELRTLLSSGQVVPHVGAEFPLAEAAQALRTVADGRAVGKVLIRVRGD